MDLKDPATPCGLVAKSYFNDEFSNFNLKGSPITIKEEDIAWATDKEYKFANVDVTKEKLPSASTTKNIWDPEVKDKDNKDAPWKNVQWIDMTNEHFIVWMRYAGLPTFRKLWGKVE